MEYLEGIEKVSQFNILNEEVEKFSSKWSQNLDNVRSLSYYK